ncbi:MAG TPA: 6,7-dimethyl-8-ribityllumazine synthase [Acidimicrobiia bacterium]|nr:6,7-dimethyl-8-ribityllumazine synthase [Acidimicrobiia bacterium]
MREVIGDLDASGIKVGIVVARWNQSITDLLLGSAMARLEELGADDVTVLHVPGALEIPVGARALVERGCDVVVVIGVVIKGETDHYDIVVSQSTSGVAQLALETGVPIGNAILAVHDVADALARAGTGDASKGVEAVNAAVETANAIAAL